MITRWLIGGIGTLIGVAMTVIMSQQVQDTNTAAPGAYPAPVVEATAEPYPAPFDYSWVTPTSAPTMTPEP